MEFLFLGLGLGAIASLAGGAAATIFWAGPWAERRAKDHARLRDFPVQTRLGVRLSRRPKHTDVATLERVLEALAIEAQNLGISSYPSTIEFYRRLNIRFIDFDPFVASNSDGTAPVHVRDPQGRRHANGKPIFVSGWHSGDTIVVVENPDVGILSHATWHEVTHEIEENASPSTYGDHQNPTFWAEQTGLVDGAKKRFVELFGPDGQGRPA